MAVSLEPLIFESFKGIREYNGIAAGGMISAISSYNTELFASDIGNGTGIKNMPGNVAIYNLPPGVEPLGIWESTQEGIAYTFIYGENSTNGILYYISNGQVSELINNLPLSDGKQCNAITMTSTAFDVFVFTNGKIAKTICFTSDITAYEDFIKNYDNNYLIISESAKNIGIIATLHPKDPLYTDDYVEFLAMCDWNGFLVVASKYGIRASNQANLYIWNDNPDPADLTTSWYIDFSKKVTAIFGFTGGLYIFNQDSISFLNTTPNDTAKSLLTTSAGNGCMNYTAICKHDLFLFFYDQNQRNIYYLSATDTTGQTKPTGPVAREIQSHFQKVDLMKMFSCVYGERNEVWCLINDEILIFDYINKEWTIRKEQPINYASLIDNHVFTCAQNGKILVENKNNDFDGGYFPSFYQTTFINAGSNSNLKKQKTPLLITVNDNYINDFFVQLVINYKEKSPKTVKLNYINGGIYAVEDDDSIYTQLETNNKYAFENDTGTIIGAIYPVENSYSKKVIEISTPQTWYSISVRIYTENSLQGFYITSMELKNIKAKLKTKGR